MKATIKATFYHKQRRNRDDINHMAMLKPAYDGIVDSGIIKDDCSDNLTTLPGVNELEVTLTEILERMESIENQVMDKQLAGAELELFIQVIVGSSRWRSMWEMKYFHE